MVWNARSQAAYNGYSHLSGIEMTRWIKEAWSAFNWFLGNNDLQIALYDPSTGGCRDGLHPERVNENQGAESTLAFLMALLEMRLLGEVDRPKSRRDLFIARNNNLETASVL